MPAVSRCALRREEHGLAARIFAGVRPDLKLRYEYFRSAESLQESLFSGGLSRYKKGVTLPIIRFLGIGRFAGAFSFVLGRFGRN